MSIKTSKRIALGVIASLVFAPFAAIAPASAAELPAGQVTAITLAKVTPAPTVGSAVYVQLGASFAALTADSNNNTDTVTIRGALTTVPSGGSVSVGTNTAANAVPAGTATPVVTTASTFAISTPATNTNTLTWTATGTTAFSAQTLAYLAGFNFTPTKTGTHVLTAWRDFDEDGSLDTGEVFQTLSIEVVAKDAFSVGTSSALMIMGNGTTAGSAATDVIPASGPAALATATRAAITVTLNDAAGAAMASGNEINVDVAGPGYVRWVSADDAPQLTQCSLTPTFGPALGRSLRGQTADAVGTLYVCSDGAVGTSTITITVTNEDDVTATLATKTIVFYGTVAKLEVSSATYTVGRAGGFQMGATTPLLGTRTAAGNLISPSTAATTANPAFIVKATDSSGNLASAAAAPTIVSGNAAVVASGTCELDTYVLAASSGNGYGYYNCNFTTAAASKSGDKATITIRIPDPLDATKFISTTLEITIGGTPHTHTLKFDKATYAQGEAMVVTRSAVDASGNPVHDGASVPSVFFSKAVGGSSQTLAGTSATGTDAWYTKGTLATSSTRPTLFAPVAYGEFEARMSGAVAGVTSAIVAKASVPAPVVPEVVPIPEKPTLTATLSGVRLFLSGTAVDGEGDIIIYVKRVGTTAWKERAKTLEVAAPGDFNGSIKAPRGNVVIRVKQEGTGQFSNQVLVLR